MGQLTAHAATAWDRSLRTLQRVAQPTDLISKLLQAQWLLQPFFWWFIHCYDDAGLTDPARGTVESTSAVYGAGARSQRSSCSQYHMNSDGCTLHAKMHQVVGLDTTMEPPMLHRQLLIARPWDQPQASSSAA